MCPLPASPPPPARGGPRSGAFPRPGRVSPPVRRPRGRRGRSVSCRVVRLRRRPPDPDLPVAPLRRPFPVPPRRLDGREADRSTFGRRSFPPLHLFRRGVPIPPLCPRGVPRARIARAALHRGEGRGRSRPSEGPGAFPGRASLSMGRGGPWARARLPFPAPGTRVGVQAAQPVPAVGRPGPGRCRSRVVARRVSAGPDRSPRHPHGAVGERSRAHAAEDAGLEDGGGDHRLPAPRVPGGPGEVRLSSDPSRHPRGVHPLPARRLPSLPRGASLFASMPERR